MAGMRTSLLSVASLLGICMLGWLDSISAITGLLGQRSLPELPDFGFGNVRIIRKMGERIA